MNRARDVYALLGVPERPLYCSTNEGHHANSKQGDPVWQAFLEYYLKQRPAAATRYH